MLILPSDTTWSISRDPDHWFSPFKATFHNIDMSESRGVSDKVINLSLIQKVAACALAIICGCLTYGIAALPVFFLATAYFKNRNAHHIDVPKTTIFSLPKKSFIFSNDKFLTNESLPPPPAHGIKTSLPNFFSFTPKGAFFSKSNANLCWLNSCVQFLASTTFYDHILKVETYNLLLSELKTTVRTLVDELQHKDEEQCDKARYKHLLETMQLLFKETPLDFNPKTGDEKLLQLGDIQEFLSQEFSEEENLNLKKILVGFKGNRLINPIILKLLLIEYLQTTLRDVVVDLRTLNGGVVETKKCGKLVQALKQLMPQAEVGSEQQDAAEFYLTLQSWFNFPATLDLLTYYEGSDPNVSKTAFRESFSQIEITIPAEELSLDAPINIQEELSTKELRMVRPDLMVDENGNSLPISEETPDAPFIRSQVFLTLPETLIVYIKRNAINEKGRQAKCKRKIDCSEPITLTQYAINGQDPHAPPKPEFEGLYEIESGIEHRGGTSGGHYVCLEKSPTGILEHNDSSTKKTKKDFSNGYFIRLKLVERRPVNPAI